MSQLHLSRKNYVKRLNVGHELGACRAWKVDDEMDKPIPTFHQVRLMGEFMGVC